MKKIYIIVILGICFIASGNDELVGETQQKITQLTHKYKELSNISGLPTKSKRLVVSGYKRKKV